MFKKKAEIFTLYMDHLESVQMSGCGHENSDKEIVGHMMQAFEEFDEGEKFIPWNVLTR